MSEITQAVNQLIRKASAVDPFQIAENLGYIVLFVPLRGIRGFHQYMKRNHIIYIDESLTAQEQKFVCAHELGHIMLHPHLNKMFMANHTYSVTSKYEVEADRFAALLCYPPEYLRQEFEGCSIYQISNAINLSVSLVEFVLK